MTYNLIGLASVALSVVAFAGAYHYLRGRALRVRLLAFCVAAGLSIPALLFAAYYLHVRPEQEWFYNLRAFPGSEFLVIFLGLAAGCFATFLPRILLGFSLFGLILVGMVPYLKPLFAPLSADTLKESWSGDACLQSTYATCGPASSATILRYHHIDSTEREAAQAAYTSASGTEAWYLARYLRSKGLSPRFAFARTFTPELGLPAIVGVRIGTMGHFIAVLSVEGDTVTFADPLGGQEQMSLADFKKRYIFTGFHLVVPARE